MNIMHKKKTGEKIPMMGVPIYKEKEYFSKIFAAGKNPVVYDISKLAPLIFYFKE